MSAQAANSGIKDVPQPVYLPLPALNKDLFAVHYSSNLEGTPNGQLPSVSAVVVKNLLSGTHLTFAAFTEAEASGILPGEFLARFPELERVMLRDFAEYTATLPDAVWVHWGMRDAVFGFDVLTLRARFYRQQQHGIPPERRFDLSHHLAMRFGDDFAPHPTLWNAAHRNLGTVADLLDDAATAEAWRNGNHGAGLRSLNAKVDVIARLFDRVRTGRFLTGAEEQKPPRDLRASAPASSRSDPALFRRPNAPGDDDFGLSQMTLRHWSILEELFRLHAFDRASSQTTEMIARCVDGAGASVASFKHPIAQLADFELVRTSTGRNGGVWLSRDGHDLAEARLQVAPQVAATAG